LRSLASLDRVLALVDLGLALEIESNINFGLWLILLVL